MNTDFYMWLKNSLAAKRFAVILFVICCGYYVLETINGRSGMPDFRVYYDAANAFIFDTQLYGKAFGLTSGFYKYSPFAAIPFIPLALLPYKVASVIYYLLLTGVFVWWLLYVFHHIASQQEKFPIKKTGIILFLSTLFLADHIERELHLGNVNLFLLIASFFVFIAIEKRQNLKAGIIYGIILLFKPHFIILLPYFVWKKEWKTVFVSVATVFIGFLIPAIAKGWQGNLEIQTQWLQAMRDHNFSLVNSPNTIYGIINRFVFAGNVGNVLVPIALLVTAIFFVLFLLRNAKRNNRFVEYFMLIALIPNLTHTDTEHFMWTCPLIVYSLVVLNLQGIRKYWFIVTLLILAFIPYCLNSPDIVGWQLRWWFDEGGLMGIANLILVLSAVYLYIRTSKISA